MEPVLLKRHTTQAHLEKLLHLFFRYSPRRGDRNVFSEVLTTVKCRVTDLRRGGGEEPIVYMLNLVWDFATPTDIVQAPPVCGISGKLIPEYAALYSRDLLDPVINLCFPYW